MKGYLTMTMAKQRRDTVTYELKQGTQVVYVGTTNDQSRREQEHKDKGKIFDHIKVTARRMTEDGVKRKESERLET